MGIWKRKNTKKDKPWGHEFRSENSFNASAKIIHIKEGHRTSLKRMKTKNQIFLMVSGLVKVHAPDESEFTENFEFVIQSGESIMVSKGSTFRLEGLKDSILVEISDNGRSESLQGVEMLEDDYGRLGIHPGIVNFKV